MVQAPDLHNLISIGASYAQRILVVRGLRGSCISSKYMEFCRQFVASGLDYTQVCYIMRQGFVLLRNLDAGCVRVFLVPASLYVKQVDYRRYQHFIERKIFLLCMNFATLFFFALGIGTRPWVDQVQLPWATRRQTHSVQPPNTQQPKVLSSL